MERRKHLRIRCRIPCEFQGIRKGLAGIVENISAAGLSVRADIKPPSEGEPVSLILRPLGSRPMALDCLAWHVRTLRNSRTDRSVTQLGLVLTRSSDRFLELVTQLAPRRRSTPARAKVVPKPCGNADLRDPKAPPTFRLFSVRLKQESGPRSRRIVIGATNSDQAAEKALAEISSGWLVLDVKPA